MEHPIRALTLDAYGTLLRNEALKLIHARIASDHGIAAPAEEVSRICTELYYAAARATPFRTLRHLEHDVYGGLPSKDLKALADAGIDVVRVDLDRLRDPNPIYSGLWRLTMKWWSGDGSGDAFLPNPLDAGPEKVHFRVRFTRYRADGSVIGSFR